MLKYNQNLKEQCTKLVLFTSESCNLQCSYCDIAQHLHKTSHQSEAKKVKESLINGQYLNTIKESFKRLELNPQQINSIELWGQEPTLTIKEFGQLFPFLYEYFSNLNHLLFSTNGVGFIDNSIEFVKILSKTVTQNFLFNIQFSYDGEFATLKNRGISSDIIINNITKYIKELNNLDLGPYLTVRVVFHNVISDDIITKYADESNAEELIQFFTLFSDLSNYFIHLNTNSNVIVRPISCSIMVPYNASVQDGKNLAQFYYNCEKYGNQIEYCNWRGLVFQMLSSLKNITWSDKILQQFKSFNNLTGQRNLDNELLIRTSHAMSCGFGEKYLKIRYDGTMLHCQNALFTLDEDIVNPNSKGNNLVGYRKKQKHFFPNILKDSDEVIDNYLYQCMYYNNEGYAQRIAQICNMMKLLLQAEQIDKKYQNPLELLRAAHFIAASTTCVHNSMMWTGSMSGTYAGWIRLLCNGFLDIIYDVNYGVIKYGNY